jgi:hypothetical protein
VFLKKAISMEVKEKSTSAVDDLLRRRRRTAVAWLWSRPLMRHMLLACETSLARCTSGREKVDGKGARQDKRTPGLVAKVRMVAMIVGVGVGVAMEVVIAKRVVPIVSPTIPLPRFGFLSMTSASRLQPAGRLTTLGPMYAFALCRRWDPSLLLMVMLPLKTLLGRTSSSNDNDKSNNSTIPGPLPFPGT